MYNLFTQLRVGSDHVCYWHVALQASFGHESPQTWCRQYHFRYLTLGSINFIFDLLAGSQL